MTKFIGEDGFYPKWAQTRGRWVHQKVCVQTGKFPLIFPPEANQSLVWVSPPKGFLGSRKISLQEEIYSSIRELNYIPFLCPNCGWQGWGKELGYAGERIYYALKCPECSENPYPDLRGLDENIIVKRWIELGKQTLEAPGAASNIVSIEPIRDLKIWIESFKPMANELAYVGQQLWPNFSTFIQATQRTDLYKKINREKFNELVQGMVFLGTEDNIIYAIDANNGNLRWNYQVKRAIVSSPIISDDTLYFGAHDKKFYALYATSGKLKWSHEIEDKINSTPVLIENIVCFGSWDGSVYALDTLSGDLLWKYKTEGRILCSPKASISTIYFGSEEGNWFALDSNSGKIRWSYHRKLDSEDDEEFGYNCVGIHNGLVYFLGSNEKLYALDADTGEEKWIYYDENVYNVYKEDSLGGITDVSVSENGIDILMVVKRG